MQVGVNGVVVGVGSRFRLREGRPFAGMTGGGDGFPAFAGTTVGGGGSRFRLREGRLFAGMTVGGGMGSRLRGNDVVAGMGSRFRLRGGRLFAGMTGGGITLTSVLSRRGRGGKKVGAPWWAPLLCAVWRRVRPPPHRSVSPGWRARRRSGGPSLPSPLRGGLPSRAAAPGARRPVRTGRPWAASALASPAGDRTSHQPCRRSPGRPRP